MIWIVTTEAEKQSLAPDKKIDALKSALGSESISRICVNATSDLNCLKEGDLVLTETKREDILFALENSGVRHTGEDVQCVKFDEDKILLKRLLRSSGILTPMHFSDLNALPDDVSFFVKPLILEDSIGIDKNSLCKSKEEVVEKVQEIRDRYGKRSIVEQYIDGYDCTVAVVKIGNELIVHAIKISTNNGDKFLTFEAKTKDTETYERLLHPAVSAVAKMVFNAIGARKYARIDMRVDNAGNVYVLEVNLYPGLGRSGYMYRCFEYNTELSYEQMLYLILSTARKS